MEYVQVIVCTVGDEELALEIQYIQEIIRVTHITRMPNSPNCLPGVINIRGMVVPVMDMARRLQISDLVISDLSRIIVVNQGDNLVGLLVDTVSEIIKLPASSIESREVISYTEVNMFVKGVGKFGSRILLVLDLDKIFELENKPDV